ncbi:RNA cap guanine-N2 methyltransferase [Spironucleus salmonicida]|uniref:Trimethylguanosine synthase n=1 Tax=Spironucleus salmonicida TaxID=348837 RepID=V6LT81_9EUKA|nr:RNA cap guanine-N2 methyltransferase [Spironucleus salmonicida]|eukprot:EST47785.1 RNA cap guanine-N2 methyltransferase [Spironucleus salmonicida]
MSSKQNWSKSYKKPQQEDKYIQRLPFFFRHLPESEIQNLKLPPHAPYSVSSFDDAFQNAYFLSKVLKTTKLVVDLTACSGVDSICMAMVFQNLISYEIDTPAFESLQNHFQIAKMQGYNIGKYELKNESGAAEISISRQNTLYFLDPPWGGPDYRNKQNIRLDYGEYIVDELAKKLSTDKTNSVFLKLPKNYDMSQFDLQNSIIFKERNQIFVLISDQANIAVAKQIKESVYDNSGRKKIQSLTSLIQQNIGDRKGLTEAFKDNMLAQQAQLMNQKLNKYRKFNDFGFFHSKQVSFGVITGFVIPEAQKGETDGPSGAIRLAIMLALNYNVKITIFTENILITPIQEMLKYVYGIFPFLPQFELISPSNPEINSIFKRQNVLFYVEKVGPTVSGKPLSMRGIDCSEFVSELFSSIDVLSFGIGDGGNEIGCGCVNPDINCVIKTDFVVLSDISNYGAGWLSRIINQRCFARFLMLNLDERELVQSGVKHGLIDGVTCKNEISVDGVDFDMYQQTMKQLYE